MTKLLNQIMLKLLPVSLIRKWGLSEIGNNQHANNTVKQLLIDVSVISKMDAETGIQRVVRNICLEFIANPPKGYRICPITASITQGYQYLPIDFLSKKTLRKIESSNEPVVKISAGDLFLGLDFAAHIVPAHNAQLLNWKQQGVKFCFFVYDLLPVNEPQWFNSKMNRNFKRWLRTVAILADQVITISQTVKSDFSFWMKKNYDLNENQLPCNSIQLGTDLFELHKNSSVSNELEMPNANTHNNFILMVGTIEPRKGHAEVLDAFEQLWSTGNHINLIIAGKRGWKVDGLMNRLANHQELGRKLHWVNSPTDKALSKLYEQCYGLIMASNGEGFGLPLIEAASFNKPILVRDIPIFREIVGNHATYFSSDGVNKLTNTLSQWLLMLESKEQNKLLNPLIWITWKESYQQLIAVLLPIDFKKSSNKKSANLGLKQARENQNASTSTAT